MINSLSKDSHISRGTSYSMQSPTKTGACRILGKDQVALTSEIKTKNPAEISFCGIFNAEKFYKSPALKKVIEFAADQQLVFGAAFSLLLTCIMRPASIMVVPSKKNKEDQKYASGHSIASGIIGFAISTAVFAPISSGIKKFSENLGNYITDKSHYLFKDEAVFTTAKIYLGRIPDIVGSIPKGILTIALIPPIMKYVFGMEKKSAKTSQASVASPVNYSLLHFKSAEKKSKSSFANFEGGVK